MYVADTHSLVWYFTNDPKLGSRSKEIFEKADKGEEIIIIPTIVLGEILFISRKHNLPFDDFLQKIEEGSGYTNFDLTIEVIKTMNQLSEQYSIHDAVIVATTKMLATKLISKDEVITTLQDVEVIW